MQRRDLGMTLRVTFTIARGPAVLLPRVGDTVERAGAPRCDEPLCAGFGQSGDRSQAEAQRGALAFERGSPIRSPSRRAAARRRRAAAHPARAAKARRNPSAASSRAPGRARNARRHGAPGAGHARRADRATHCRVCAAAGDTDGGRSQGGVGSAGAAPIAASAARACGQRKRLRSPIAPATNRSRIRTTSRDVSRAGTAVCRNVLPA